MCSFEDADDPAVKAGVVGVLEVSATYASFQHAIECRSVVVGEWVDLAEDEWNTGGEVKVNLMFVVNVSVDSVERKHKSRCIWI